MFQKEKTRTNAKQRNVTVRGGNLYVVVTLVTKYNYYDCYCLSCISFSFSLFNIVIRLAN